MTDNEIIKVLECCTSKTYFCGDCPLSDYGDDCGNITRKEALNIIQRLKAEIEELNGDLIVERTRRKNAVDAYHEAKAEAIKEFVKNS